MNCFKLVLFLGLLWVVGCDSAEPIPPTSVQPTVARTETPLSTLLPPTITLTAEPSSTATEPLPTYTPTLVPTTNTPTLVATSTPIPTQTPQPLTQLPDWVSDPTQPVFFATSYGHRGAPDYAVSLFNAESGERVDIETPSSISFRWVVQDGQIYLRFGHPTRDGVRPKFHELLNIATGEVTEIPVTNRFGYHAPDGSQIVYTEVNDGLVQITLRDLETGSETGVTSLFDNKEARRTVVNWSVDNQFFAIHQVGAGGEGVSIYNRHGEPYRLYDNLSGVKWSPTLPHRLLHNPNGDYQRACILDLESSEVTCLGATEAWRELYGNNVFAFVWMPNGKSVSFSYWDYEQSKSGVCVMSLESEEITCPLTTKDLVPLTEIFSWSAFVRTYFWSPDEKYLVVFANASPPTSSDGTSMVAGVLDVESGEMLWFDPTSFSSSAYFSSDIWRPEIASGE